MLRHMRTTVEISDSLLAEVRRLMAERKTTLRALVEDGLRRVVEERRQDPPPPLPHAAFPGEPGFAAGANAADLPALIAAEIHRPDRS